MIRLTTLTVLLAALVSTPAEAKNTFMPMAKARAATQRHVTAEAAVMGATHGTVGECRRRSAVIVRCVVSFFGLPDDDSSIASELIDTPAIVRLQRGKLRVRVLLFDE